MGQSRGKYSRKIEAILIAYHLTNTLIIIEVAVPIILSRTFFRLSVQVLHVVE